MNLARFSRRWYPGGVMPLKFLPRSTRAVYGPNIYMKRGDLPGLTAGGQQEDGR
jgi:1-aminocyclopropane-1-carboxylate deaminase/D-cysteine desulfhydrase-like pyridoxal-dependent ACC family enzyme